MEFIKSLDKVKQSIEHYNLKTVPGKSKLSIVVDNRYEIFLTHYPLWNNEKFLYSIGCVLNKIILEKNIPEEMVADIYYELKSKENFQVQNHKFVLN